MKEPKNDVISSWIQSDDELAKHSIKEQQNRTDLKESHNELQARSLKSQDPARRQTPNKAVTHAAASKESSTTKANLSIFLALLATGLSVSQGYVAYENSPTSVDNHNTQYQQVTTEKIEKLQGDFNVALNSLTTQEKAITSVREHLNEVTKILDTETQNVTQEDLDKTSSDINQIKQSISSLEGELKSTRELVENEMKIAHEKLARHNEITITPPKKMDNSIPKGDSAEKTPSDKANRENSKPTIVDKPVSEKDQKLITDISSNLNNSLEQII